MKFTIDWLKQHLDTKYNDEKIIDKLTNVGLEVESFECQSSEQDEFVVAKIVNAEQHPNADRLSVCDVDIGKEEVVKVVCGASNAKKNLITVYAPPDAVIPKNQMKLSVSKIRGVTSYGMLCSESELKLSDESEGITELPSKKYNNQIGKKYFKSNSPKVIDLSTTPNRADCLGVRGVARDLAAAGAGKLKKFNENKIKFKGPQKIKVKITKEKNQGCSAFGSCLIKGIKNTESPKWLKDKILSLGQKPISAIVDVTNYIMFDLNRPLHAYDADKINEGIIVRNSKKGETFEALDNKKYTLQDNMCVISDKSGVLGLGGIIGGIRSGTELDTKNILLESAYFNPKSIRKTSKLLNLDTDAKFRFERGIDPDSIEEGLVKAATLIQKICGGEISKLNVQKSETFKKIQIRFPIALFQSITGFKIAEKEIMKILTDLGFVIKKKNNDLNLTTPSWRPDILQPIDIVEEIVRIKGYDQIKTELPEKVREKPTLNKQQKLFHFLQRSVASKGYYETVTWSFTDSKINQLFKEDKNEVEIVNPISSDLNVLRSSIFSNLIIYLKKNLDRGFKDISLFEIGPIFNGNKPGQQKTVLAGLRSGKVSRHNWIENERLVDVFDAKRDVIQSLIETGFNQNKLYIDDKAPSYYHPGKSGCINFLNKSTGGFFGEIHPDIIKKFQINYPVYAFELNLNTLPHEFVENKKSFNSKNFQKVERDFAFILDKKIQSQVIIDLINKVENKLISEINIFDVYEGEGIPEEKKSIAVSIVLQPEDRTLKDTEIEIICKNIISNVVEKTGAILREK